MMNDIIKMSNNNLNKIGKETVAPSMTSHHKILAKYGFWYMIYKKRI